MAYLFQGRMLTACAFGMAVSDIFMVRPVAQCDAHNRTHTTLALARLGMHVQLRSAHATHVIDVQAHHTGGPTVESKDLVR